MHDLVYILDTLQRIVRQRIFERTIELLAEYRLQSLVYERRFAAAAHTRHTDELAQGEVYRHILKVVASRASQHKLSAVAFAQDLRNLYLPYSSQIIGCHGVSLHQVFRRTGEYHITAVSTRLRAHVNDIIRRHHHVLVVLHDYHRIAYIAKVFQRFNQSVVVSLMQADARFIQYIKHIDKLRAYLCR